MIYDIYSKRQKRLRGEFPDVYQYEHIPNELRNQVIYILKDNFGLQFYEKMFCEIYKILCREYGWTETEWYPEDVWRWNLSPDERDSYNSLLIREDQERVRQREELRQFFVSEKNADRVIDVIESSFRYIEQWKEDEKKEIEKQLVAEAREFGSNSSNISVDDITHDDITHDGFFVNMRAEIEDVRQKKKKVNEAIEELNIRFYEHDVGYQYESGQIIKVDSQYVHSEVVRPVLNLLSDPMYQGANEEFLKAHEHNRKGDYESCIIECSKAFESVLKIICDHRGWRYNPKDTAKPLLDIVYKNGLLPTHAKSFFNGVRSGLEHGVPVTRNKYAAHGQGNQKVPVPDYMAENMLNLTASSILLLVKANKAMP